MKFRNIRVRMLVNLLPIILLSCIALTAIAVVSSKQITNDEISEQMTAKLGETEMTMESELKTVSATAASLAMGVSATYKSVPSIAAFEQMLTGSLRTAEVISGAGVWFEPYSFDPEQKYVGPYVYEDENGDPVVTYDYSTADYDYLSQDYYTIASTIFDPIITDPYYDATSSTIMSTCAAPVYTTDPAFLGCITVDITLDKIEDIINNVKVGETGYAMLMTGSGVYLAGAKEEYIQNGVSILDDENASLASIGSEILANEDGSGTFEADGDTYNIYYTTVTTTGWKIAVCVPHSELYAPIQALTIKMVLVCVLALILCIIVVFLQVNYISKNLKNVQLFAGSLAEGDFTIEPLEVASSDELGVMGNSLNDMFEHNHNVIQGISEYAITISDSSDNLNSSAVELQQQFQNIEQIMSQINEAMMSASAATQEVNASVEEVNASVNILANETNSSMALANDIEKRANDIGQQSQKSFDSANALSRQFEENLSNAIENAKVVETIGTLANVISDIAEEITLLALNASIEAARAGEQGKGFAVVATEIGNLANATSETVGNIQATIQSVQDAFNELSSDAQDILGFVTETVTPDYNNFVSVANQYGEDAKSIAEMSDMLSQMTTNIHQIMNEVTEAIENIAESAQNTAGLSGEIMDSVSSVSEEVTNVNSMAEDQHSVARELRQIVDKFKLS